MNVYWLSKWLLCSYGNPHVNQTIAEIMQGNFVYCELIFTHFLDHWVWSGQKEKLWSFLVDCWHTNDVLRKNLKMPLVNYKVAACQSTASPLWFSDACDSYFSHHTPWLSSNFLAGIDIGIDKLQQHHNLKPICGCGCVASGVCI